MVYEGMNSEYYIGMKVPYYRDTMELEIPKEQEWTGMAVPPAVKASFEASMPGLPLLAALT